METTKYLLKELLTIKNGKDHKTLSDGPYPVFGSGGLMRYAEKYLYDKVSILLPRKGTLDNIQYVDRPFWTVDTIYYTVVNEKLADPYYLYCYINSLDLSGYDSGASIPSMTQKAYNKIKISLPKKDVQVFLGKTIKTYEDLIENNKKRINLLEQMAGNLYREWFVRFRFPNYESTSFENGVPKTFEYLTVEQLCDVLQRGISPAYDDEGKYCVISQKCIRKNIMDISEARKQSKEFKPVLNLRDGDTVICSTGTGTLGRVGQVYGDYPDTTFDSHVTLVRAKNNIGKHFLFYSLKNLQPWFMNMGIGSTNQQELYKKTIQKAKILVPDTALMKSFEEHIEQIHKQIIALSKANDNLIKQRDLLLPRLMSGKLEV